MLKPLLSALVISGSLIATASLAYAQTAADLDNNEKAPSFQNVNPLQLPVVYRSNATTHEVSVATLSKVPSSLAEANELIKTATFTKVPDTLIVKTDEQASSTLAQFDKDHSSGATSYFRYGGGGYGNYGRGGWGGGFRGGYAGNFGYGYGNYYGGGFRRYAPWIGGGWYGGYAFPPIYTVYSPYSPVAYYGACAGWGYGDSNYALYYGGGVSWY